MKTYESIVKGESVPQPGVPESFKVLIKELQSLCLDMRVLDENMQEVTLKDSSEEEEEASVGMSIKNDAAFIDLDLGEEEDAEDLGDEIEDDGLLDEELSDGLEEETEAEVLDDSDEFDEEEEAAEDDFIDDLDLL